MKIERVYREFGDAIQRARCRNGISQAVLAKRVKLSRPSIVNIEAGRQRVLLHMAVRLAKEAGLKTFPLKLWRD